MELGAPSREHVFQHRGWTQPINCLKILCCHADLPLGRGPDRRRSSGRAMPGGDYCAGVPRAHAGLPEWIRPQLTGLVDAAPDGLGWLHEIKFDGYRMHARLDRGGVRLLTRTGLDWTHKYPAIAAAVSSLGVARAYLDGELCGVRPDGITSFSMIQAASDAGNAAGLVFYLFDLLHLDGEARSR
jgi:ATP-dependent DNA ligase